MLAIIILLALACLGLCLRVYTSERSLRSAARQLRENVESGSAARLGLAAPNGAAEELVAAVDGLLELRRSDAAAYREREAELRRQIANISHDLRTPLTSILGYLQLLDDPALGEGERREYLAVVTGRAKALQSLITSFYDLSRLEGGEFPLEREAVDVGQVLRSLLASFYGDFTDAGFDVRVALDENVPTVTADGGAVLRVFTNLLRNALDHGAGRMDVSLRVEDGRVVSRVSNGAAGLSAEDLPHVFDRFFTADKMRTGRNTGLGLAIVKALCDRMGAGVSAELAQGMFTVTIVWN